MTNVRRGFAVNALTSQKPCMKLCKIQTTWICPKCDFFNFSDDELSKLESDNGSWYCANCKAVCGLCSGAVLNGQKAVQCDKCTTWVRSECSYITETLYETVQNSNYLDLPKMRPSIFPMMNSQNWNQTMDLGIVQTAKLSVVYAVVLY